MNPIQDSCCIFCVHYSPNATFSWMGLCKLNGKFVVSKPSCENFTEVDLKKVFGEGGWAYCLTCRTPIFSENELLSHVGHDVAFELCFDEVACEDSPSGD